METALPQCQADTRTTLPKVGANISRSRRNLLGPSWEGKEASPFTALPPWTCIPQKPHQINKALEKEVDQHRYGHLLYSILSVQRRQSPLLQPLTL